MKIVKAAAICIQLSWASELGTWKRCLDTQSSLKSQEADPEFCDTRARLWRTSKAARADTADLKGVYNAAKLFKKLM